MVRVHSSNDWSSAWMVFSSSRHFQNGQRSGARMVGGSHLKQNVYGGSPSVTWKHLDSLSTDTALISEPVYQPPLPSSGFSRKQLRRAVCVLHATGRRASNSAAKHSLFGVLVEMLRQGMKFRSCTYSHSGTLPVSWWSCGSAEVAGTFS